MRIIITFLTNKREGCYAIDFYSSWPFIAWEKLPVRED